MNISTKIEQTLQKLNKKFWKQRKACDSLMLLRDIPLAKLSQFSE